MSILYSVIASVTESIIVAEFASTSGNFLSIAQSLLQKLSPVASNMTYTYEEYLFHYKVKNGWVFLCVTDLNYNRRTAFLFLDQVIKSFEGRYGYVNSMGPVLSFELNEFSLVLQSLMNQFLEHDSDKINNIKGEIAYVKDIMVENIEKVLERGEKIESLVTKTDALQLNAFRFKQKSSTLKRSLWCRNIFWLVVLVLVLLIIIYGATSAACGFPDWNKCIKI